MPKLNDREKRFAAVYVGCGNAYKAAIEAGYSKATAKKASMWLNQETPESKDEKIRKLYKPALVEEVKRLNEEIEKARIADAKEMQEKLTGIIRQLTKEEVILLSALGDVIRDEKTASIKDIIAAIKLLASMQGLMQQNVTLSGAAQVVIVDDIENG